MNDALSPAELQALFPQLFGSTPVAQLDAVAERLDSQSVAAGTAIVRRGTPSGSLVLVAEGKLVVSITEGGKKLEMAEVGPGDWIGEVAFLDRGEATTDVVASTRSRILVLSEASFDRLCEEHPRVARDLLHALCTRLSARLRRTARLLHDEGVDGSWRTAPLEPHPSPTGSWLDRIRQSLYRHAQE
jgi:CRP-like cAMP-binding protein